MLGPISRLKTSENPRSLTESAIVAGENGDGCEEGSEEGTDRRDELR